MPTFNPPRLYRTFIRTSRDWKSFASARKRWQDSNLTFDEARRACEEFNRNLTPAQIRRGTKMEFTS